MKTKILSKNLILNDQGLILVLKRKADDFRRPNCWDFPGGGKESSEDIYESAIREIQEEVGLKAHDLQVVYVESGMGIDTSKEDVLALCFVVKEWSGQVKLSDEHSQFEWVAPVDFLELETGDDGGFLHNCVRVYLKK